MAINHRIDPRRFRRLVADFINVRSGLVKAKGNTSSASIANTEAAIVWATPAIATQAGVTVSGSEITCVNAGTYRFTVSLQTVSNNRTELIIKTYIDTGSGKTQDTDEIASNYAARDTDRDTGGMILVSVLELDAGDVVEFRGEGDCDGTCTMADAGTQVIVERLE